MSFNSFYEDLHRVLDYETNMRFVGEGNFDVSNVGVCKELRLEKGVPRGFSK